MANAALKSDGCHVLFLGSVIIVRIIFRGNLKVTLVLGIICIRVKGFFFGLLLVSLLDEEIEAAASRQ